MRSEPQSARTLVWALSISLAATFEITVVFSSSGYLDVSVHRVPYIWLCIHHMLTEVLSARFPHSDISGSQDMCSSPKLFAAYHVFHRLLVPRHPPCALTTLTVAGTIESFDSLFPHWCIALHQRALCFHFPISLLTMKFEFIWCLDSFSFLKMNSILILVWSFQGTSVLTGLRAQADDELCGIFIFLSRSASDCIRVSDAIEGTKFLRFLNTSVHVFLLVLSTMPSKNVYS